MKKEALQFFTMASVTITFFTGLISLVIVGIWGIGSNLVQIESGYSVMLFALATFGWLIPLQLLSLIRMLPVQRRPLRIVFPYVESLFQIAVFVLYLIGLNTAITSVNFTNIGMVTFAAAMVIMAKVVFAKMNEYARKLRKKNLEESLSRD
ncbi:hypothetical protein JSY36_04115 [Bacillus sp. H-16]|uniref:hypothetical protein n=1 Tax=Alteribacter salitolerans TaxID=2912333 RepID=UPI001966AA4A|nr:hypothetical protein [Alteribacter salitolerans]MBM7094935.1 hypothetical protein [Alteribacter salitolerans]